MKRARKSPVTPNRTPDSTLDSTTGSTLAPALDVVPKERFLWISFASEEIDKFRQAVSELDWVRTRLEFHFPVDVLVVKQSSEAPNQISQYLERRALEHLSSSQVPTRVLVSSLLRSDPIAEVISKLKSGLPDCHASCILGQWWIGHKRTQPLPPGSSVFYWYELYDLLLPELKTHSQPPIFSDVKAPDTVPFESALICSDNPELRRMWSELLQQYGIHAVALIDFDAIPESEFSYVLVDVELNQSEILSGMGDTQHGLLKLVATLRKRCSGAVIATLLSFPQWQVAQAVLELGANIVAGKPCRISGLISSLRSFAEVRKR
jgi:CheY-like chemotaxis protein